MYMNFLKLRHKLESILPAAVVVLGSLMLLSAMLDTEDTIPVMTPGTEAAPTVAIDPGHGGWDGGAVSPKGIEEAGLNLEYAKALEKELKSRGYAVVLTRSDSSTPGTDKAGDLDLRRRIIEDARADIAVSIHMNKFGDPSVSGPMVFYMKGSDEGGILAEHIIKALCAALKRPERLANPGDYYMLREITMPAVIVECGFLSNGSDEALLQTEEYKMSTVKGIADGIDAYLFPVPSRSE